MKQTYLLIALSPWFAAFSQQSATPDPVIATMENITLEADSYWNGSDGSGGFESGLCYFHNSYTPEYGSWSGWAVSNVMDVTTPGFGNQYSAITGLGVNRESSGGPNYAVAYPIGASVVSFVDEAKHEVAGFYVTNSTYAALSMKNGDAFSKKFGGASGDDPDWFKLTIKGLDNEVETGAVEFYLADFRFEDNTDDYILKTWEWVDLSSLGEVTTLEFTLSSSDMGEWGMNTPGYFCVDNLHVLPATSTGINDKHARDIAIYPVPFTSQFTISGENLKGTLYRVCTLGGQVVLTGQLQSNHQQITTSQLPAGTYLILIETPQGVVTQKAVKL